MHIMKIYYWEKEEYEEMHWIQQIIITTITSQITFIVSLNYVTIFKKEKRGIC